MKRMLLILACTLAACFPTRQSDGPAAGDFGADMAAQQEAACISSGGRWGQGGKAGTLVCYRPTPDANRSCTASSQCDGMCLARSGTCTPVKPLFGCHDILIGLGTESTICID